MTQTISENDFTTNKSHESGNFFLVFSLCSSSLPPSVALIHLRSLYLNFVPESEQNPQKKKNIIIIVTITARVKKKINSIFNAFGFVATTAVFVCDWLLEKFNRKSWKYATLVHTIKYTVDMVHARPKPLEYRLYFTFFINCLHNWE